ncbi:MAG: UDP-N-acetylmuramate--L-alanine ligase, partial [Candidatus Wallbacteria bacterium]|nr:UDP-N-acetylmuramate--L-alanine ligase [Candidatus Wallbacteria bacterium]
MLTKNQNIHFIGIGGTGMSGLARMMHAEGFIVSGSDSSSSQLLDTMASEGIRIFRSHNSANILHDTQVVVHTVAVKQDNPEMQSAAVRGIPVIKYASMVGEVMKGKTGIAVSGTHGKTTTTSMISYALVKMGCDPSFIIGGQVPQLGGSSGVGNGDFFVVEACEYDRSFHNFRPSYAIINNIEEDHLDYYRDLDEIIESFRTFALGIPSDGILFYSKSSPNISRFIDSLPCRKISYAVEQPADYRAVEVNFDGRRTYYTLIVPDGSSFVCELSLTGMHNVIDSLAAFSLLHALGFPTGEILSCLKNFRGVKRRMEYILDDSHLTIIDDYAHHPTEVRTVLRSLRRAYPDNRIITIFQPHQHSRTRFLLKDFAVSFSC